MKEAGSTVLEAMTELNGSIHVTPKGKVKVKDVDALRKDIDRLAEKSALGTETEQREARWLIWESAQALGIRPASIHDLYLARGRGETRTDFTVPAMNLRALSYDAARAAFRAAKGLDAAALLFEIARSEIGYTAQRPAEYTASILAAAIKEDYAGPVFIQGDHFQVNHKKYAASPEGEVGAVRSLTEEAIANGFFNIDIDTSTLVDLSKTSIADQQAVNYTLCAELTAYIRGLQPKGVDVSVGGEIGEVGGKNSTEAELRAFMDGYNGALLEQKVGRRKRGGVAGISKISIQTGTSHGGVVLADGTIADVAVDFDTLRRLSHVARTEYGLAGAVQHGASTLPESAFRKFAEAGACEVHLATNFQNMLYDRLPDDLKAEIYDWLKTNAEDERKPTDTEGQFFYKTRKKAIGPFKSKMWGLPAEKRDEIRQAWQDQFTFLFRQLNITGTRADVEKHVSAPEIHVTLDLTAGPEREPEDVRGLAD